MRIDCEDRIRLRGRLRNLAFMQQSMHQGGRRVSILLALRQCLLI
jgi:hypothetical protein